MYETYRILGREHELDLEREAAQRRLASALPPKPGRSNAPTASPRRRRLQLVPRPLLAWLAR